MIKPLIIGAVIGAIVAYVMGTTKGANVLGVTGAPNAPAQFNISK